jgi:hypothetical protein
MADQGRVIRLPARDEAIAPVRILDAEGRVVSVLSAEEFRETHQGPVVSRFAPGAGRSRRAPHASRLAGALAYVIASMLALAGASGEPPPTLGADAFRVSLREEADLPARRVEGLVRNTSAYRVTNVRLHVRGLDADGRLVGRTFAWALGDIVPGGDSSFAFQPIPEAVEYDIAVVSYDLVSRPAPPDTD